MNTSKKGRRNEHRTIKRLESLGYYCLRSAASKGIWDVVAVGPDNVLLIQVKSNDWPGSEEMAAMTAFIVPPRVQKWVYRWCDRQREPDTRIVP